MPIDEGMTESEVAFFDNPSDELPGDAESAPSPDPAPASTPAEAPAAAAAPAPAPAAPAEPPVVPEKTVPLAALHQARMEQRELKQQLEQTKAQFQQQLEAQSAQLQQLLTARQQAALPELPDPEVDPVGHFMGKIGLLEQQLADAKREQQALNENRTQAEQQAAQQREAQAQHQQYWTHVNSQEQQFVADGHADFPQSVTYLKQQLCTQLENNGMLPQDASRQAAAQLDAVMRNAVHTGTNPAAVVYYMAQARGYAIPAPAAPPAPAPVAPSAAVAQVAQIIKGQAAAKSLSSTGGKVEGELTLEALADMDPAEMDKHWERASKMMR